MYHRWLIFGSLFLVSFLIKGQTQNPYYSRQNETSPQTPQQSIRYIQDSRLDTLRKRFREYNLKNQEFDGYRINIFFDAGNQSSSRAYQAAKRFRMLYPEDSAYVSFSEPYYRVRVGDFRTQLEAEAYLQRIIQNYPNAYIVKDKINFPKLD